MCLKDPELDVDVEVHSDLRRFVEAWRGFRDLRAEIRSGRVKVLGPRAYREALPDWLLLSALADVPRLRAGAERRSFRRTASRSASRGVG